MPRESYKDQPTAILMLTCHKLKINNHAVVPLAVTRFPDRNYRQKLVFT